jgi:hypothetical protein
MATGGELVTGAYRKLGIKPADSDITGSEMKDGIETLNDMMFELENSGILFGYERINSPSEVARIPVGTENGVKATLAGYLAADLHKQITPTLAAQIAESRTNMLRILRGNITVKFPATLPIGSGNKCNGTFNRDRNFFRNNKKLNF